MMKNTVRNRGKAAVGLILILLLSVTTCFTACASTGSVKVKAAKSGRQERAAAEYADPGITSFAAWGWTDYAGSWTTGDGAAWARTEYADPWTTGDGAAWARTDYAGSWTTWDDAAWARTGYAGSWLAKDGVSGAPAEYAGSGTAGDGAAWVQEEDAEECDGPAGAGSAAGSRTGGTAESADPDAEQDLAAGDVEEILESMSLRDKLAQMMFFSPRTREAEPGSLDRQNVYALDDEMKQYIREHRFGGMLLYAENFADAEQALRLTADLRAETIKGGAPMPFVAADQEGGLVTRVNFGTVGPGNMALAATGDPSCARDMAKIYGDELSLLGISVDFAPVVDVNDNPANPVIGVRSFGDDARSVGEFGCAFMEGLHDKGTIACLKHFPGHGNTDTDSHTGLPQVDRSLEELMENELVPFREAVEAGADMVMTAHIQYPQVEKETCASVSEKEELLVPATMSRTILTDLLRGELGFDGVIVSDALDMAAIKANFTVDDVLKRCIGAGVDMLLLPCDPAQDMWAESDELLDRAVELTREGAIDEDRVNDSVRRILALKQKYGMLEEAAPEVTDEMIEAAQEGCGSKKHKKAARKIADKALTLLKNENDAFPIDVKKNETTLILFSTQNRVGAGGLALALMEKEDRWPEGAKVESMYIDMETEKDCEQAVKDADHVIFVSRAWGTECLQPTHEDGYHVDFYNRMIDRLHKDGKTAVVISALLPYDAACYPEADAILLCYFSSYMEDVPDASWESDGWAANLPDAICAAFGRGEPEGRLPVNVPSLDEDYQLTTKILYPRQEYAGEKASRGSDAH